MASGAVENGIVGIELDIAQVLLGAAVERYDRRSEPNELRIFSVDPKSAEIKGWLAAYTPRGNGVPRSVKDWASNSFWRKVLRLRDEVVPTWLGKVSEEAVAR